MTKQDLITYSSAPAFIGHFPLMMITVLYLIILMCSSLMCPEQMFETTKGFWLDIEIRS